MFATDGRRILLVEEHRDDGSTFWTLPGGGLGPAKPSATGLRREVAEELGCDAVLQRAVTRCTYRHRTRPDTVTVYTVDRGSLVGEPQPDPAEGVVRYAWSTPLPEGTLAPFRRVIEELTDVDERS